MNVQKWDTFRRIVTPNLLDLVEFVIVLHNRLGIPFIHSKPLLDRLLIIITPASPSKSLDHDILRTIKIQHNFRLNNLPNVRSHLQDRKTYILLKSLGLIHFPRKPVNQETRFPLCNILLHLILQQSNRDFEGNNLAFLNVLCNQGSILAPLASLFAAQQVAGA
jgi:hypothetical protein